MILKHEYLAALLDFEWLTSTPRREVFVLENALKFALGKRLGARTDCEIAHRWTRPGRVFEQDLKSGFEALQEVGAVKQGPNGAHKYAFLLRADPGGSRDEFHAT